jgi:hypothetical protein
VFTSFVPDAARDNGVATCNGMVVWSNLFEGINVLSGSGVAVGQIVDASGEPFSQDRLGRLCFYGNELVIADAAGLEFLLARGGPVVQGRLPSTGLVRSAG